MNHYAGIFKRDVETYKANAHIKYLQQLSDIKKGVPLDENKKKLYFASLKEIQQTIDRLNNYKISVKINEKELKSEAIAAVPKIIKHYYGKLTKENFHNPEIVLDFSDGNYSDTCILPNGNIAFSSCPNSCVNIYTHNLRHVNNIKVVKTTENADGFTEIRPISVTSDNQNHFYIAEVTRLLVTDMELNLLRRISLLTERNHDNPIEDAILSYVKVYDQFIYVFFQSDNVLLIFDFDFNKPIQIDLGERFETVLIENGMLVGATQKLIYFYTLSNLQLKLVYKVDEKTHMDLFSIDNYFYVFTKSDSSFHCFNNDGGLIDKFHIDFTKYSDQMDQFEPYLFYNHVKRKLYSDIGNGIVLIYSV